VFKRDKSGRSAEAPDATATGALSPTPDDGDPQEFPGGHDELMAGRDYVGDDATLEEMTPTDLSMEPAHV